MQKLLGSLNAPNLWKQLFPYDKLTINNGCYLNLTHRLLKLISQSQNDPLKEIIDYFKLLPDNIVCLIPNKNMCNHFNNAILESMEQPEFNQ